MLKELTCPLEEEEEDDEDEDEDDDEEDDDDEEANDGGLESWLVPNELARPRDTGIPDDDDDDDDEDEDADADAGGGGGGEGCWPTLGSCSSLEGLPWSSP